MAGLSTLNIKPLNAAPPAQSNSNGKTIKVTAAMGVPRTGFNDFWGCVQQALFELRIPIRKFTGCFWHHQLQMALETCVRDGFDYVLTLDYDTTFTVEHLRRILQYTQLYPQYDAIAGLQMKRDVEHALMSKGDAKGVELGTENITPVDTAHFGFTIINTRKLATMPKPWFHEIPDADGSWSDSATHPDTYFWKQWKAQGHTLGIATDIRVGHMEPYVSGYDEHFKPYHVPIAQWIQGNRSAEVNACTD